MDPPYDRALRGPSYSSLDNVAYGGCNTRIVDLQDIRIPEQATDQEYHQIFRDYCREKTEQSANLEAAIGSITTGIAPPVAFPTETVYGLGADATNRMSVAGIFAAKGRPSDNPLIVHVSSAEHLQRLLGRDAVIPPIYKDLIEDHWPGPLTILLPLPDDHNFAPNVHPGQRTIGFRVPLSKYARFFIAAADRPIAGPSANSSGRPSPTTAKHVYDDMHGKINFILDGGSCDVGVESTVVDGLCDPPLILRPGGLSRTDLIKHGEKYGNAWARVAIGYKEHSEEYEDPKNHVSRPNDLINDTQEQNNPNNAQSSMLKNQAPRAPGMKYKHYAPNARMTLVRSLRHEDDARISNTMQHTIANMVQKEASKLVPLDYIKIAILTTTAWSPFIGLGQQNIDGVSSLVSQSANASNQLLSVQSIDAMLSGSQTGQTKAVNARIYSISLGTTSAEVSNRLFAALRICDDLGCNLIFAEAPTPLQTGTEDEMAFETVLERMRKAATEIVQA